MTVRALVVGAPGSGKSLLSARLGACLGTRRGGPLWRRRPAVTLVDTVGLGDAVEADPARRRQQGQLLLELARAPLVLHLVNTPRLGEGGAGALPGADRELIAWGGGRAGYALVAARMDLPWAWTGLEVLRQWPGAPRPVPVSACTGLGFGELRAFLLARLRAH